MRPSKLIFNKEISKFLDINKYKSVLDVASADFKNINLFKSDNYTGIDIDPDLISEGLRKYPNAKGISGDIMDIQNLVRQNKYDLCISTHTLSYLTEENILNAVNHLISVNANEGSIIINLQSNQHLSNKILDLFKENYQNYYHVRYQNLYTRYIEKLFENSLGVFNPGKIGRLIVKISLAYYLESLTSRYNFTGNSYIFFGKGLNIT